MNTLIVDRHRRNRDPSGDIPASWMVLLRAVKVGKSAVAGAALGAATGGAAIMIAAAAGFGHHISGDALDFLALIGAIAFAVVQLILLRVFVKK